MYIHAVDHLPPAPPPPLLPPPARATADESVEPPRSIPSTRTGWLDAALAHSRERARLRQAEEAARKEHL
ncbi:hypothetical protein [Candidatus Viridilinea mediisalina]|uniref:hypothetical protein n=1 Tax=Candidatus Viridilinea mediisalina TaxID=2024553 RepID=UPI0013FD612D|nr:hypothetical protein [Candidatus Viridilinea mediisalina]